MSKTKFISDNSYIPRNDTCNKNYDNLDLESLKILLNNKPELAELKDEKGQTILFRAVMTGNNQLSEYLLEKMSVNPNIKNIHRETPLHHAIENSNHKIINLLLEKGADPNLQEQEGETPMHIAAVKGDYKVLKLLSLYGGEPLISTFKYGYTSLDYATERGNQKCIEVLQNIISKKTHYYHDHPREGLKTTKNSNSSINRIKDSIHLESVKYSRNNFKDENLISDNLFKMPGSYNKERERNYSCQLDYPYRNKPNIPISKSKYDKIKQNLTISPKGETNFLNQMNVFEERLERIKKDLMDNVKHTEPRLRSIQSINLNSTNNSNNNNINVCSQNLPNILNNPRRNTYSTNNLPSYLNYSNLINKHNLKTQFNKEVINVNADDDMVITIYPNEDFDNSNISECASSNTRLFHRVSKSKSHSKSKTHNFNFEETGNKILAVFISSKNDIDENYIKSNNQNEINENGYTTTLKNIEEGENTINQRYADMFNFNIKEMNEFILNTECEDDEGENYNEEDDKFVDTFLNQETIQNKQPSAKKLLISNEHFNTSNSKHLNTARTKYLTTSNRKEIIRKFSEHSHQDLYLQKPNFNLLTNSFEINFENARRNSQCASAESIKEVNLFLKGIEMEKYTKLFIQNGFDDMKLVINQMKRDLAITDMNLKEIGIALPGHRAKILIKLEEESKNFDFDLPSNVFYTIPNSLNYLNTSNLDTNSDICVLSIHSWLKNLKLEHYLVNFINAGYHSLELLLVQMASKSPLNEKILEDDLKIDKIGYRIRILNKLFEDSKAFVKKSKCKLTIIDKKDDTSCKCLIF